MDSIGRILFWAVFVPLVSLGVYYVLSEFACVITGFCYV